MKKCILGGVIKIILKINNYSDNPIYKQLCDQIIIGISEGKLVPGEELPTVRALANEIGINAMTVNKAYQILKQEGYIVIDRRKGAKVCEQFGKETCLEETTRDQLRKIISEAKIRGLTKEDFLRECDRIYGGEKR